MNCNPLVNMYYLNLLASMGLKCNQLWAGLQPLCCGMQSRNLWDTFSVYIQLSQIMSNENKQPKQIVVNVTEINVTCLNNLLFKV